MSKAVDDDRETKAGEKAEAEDKRAAVIPINFMVEYMTRDKRKDFLWICMGKQ